MSPGLARYWQRVGRHGTDALTFRYLRAVHFPANVEYGQRMIRVLLLWQRIDSARILRFIGMSGALRWRFSGAQ